MKLKLQDAMHDVEDVQLKHKQVIDENGALKAQLAEFKNMMCPLSHLRTVLDELRREKSAHEQLKVEHQMQSGRLDLCRTALRLANEERIQLRGTADRYRACQRVSDNLEDTLIQTLEVRDMEITKLKVAL